MAILALTMGPHLGIIMVPTVLSVGSAGTITFKAVGANGNVRWKLISSNLPDEWDASLNVSGGQATLETDEIEVPGTFTVTVQCTDESRVPVVRTFAVRLMALPLTIFGAFPDWFVGQPATGALTISGGVPPYSGLSVTSGALPSGVSLSIVGNQIVAGGVPASEGSWAATLQVSDDSGTPALISVIGNVEESFSPWNISPLPANCASSDNGFRITRSGGSDSSRIVVHPIQRSSGKFALRFIAANAMIGSSVCIGVRKAGMATGAWLGANSNGWGMWWGSSASGGQQNRAFSAGSQINLGGDIGTGSVELLLEIDIDNGLIWPGVGGSGFWGSPSAGTGAVLTGFTGPIELVLDMYYQSYVKLLTPDQFITPPTAGFLSGWPD